MNIKTDTMTEQAERLCVLVGIERVGPVPLLATPKGDVIVHIKPWQDEVILDKLIAIKKRQGAGTAAMRMICDAADKLGITLTLASMPLQTPGRGVITSRKLMRFYHSFGFMGRTPNDLRMKRTPRR